MTLAAVSLCVVWVCEGCEDCERFSPPFFSRKIKISHRIKVGIFPRNYRNPRNNNKNKDLFMRGLARDDLTLARSFIIKWEEAMKEKINIENALIWAYQKQRVAQVRLFEIEALKRALGCGGQYSVLELGCHVDNSSMAARLLGNNVHEDALVIDEQVCLLPMKFKLLVLAHAALGTRPDWYGEDSLLLVPERTENGKVRRLYDDNKHLIGTYVRSTVSHELVQFSREQYLDWWCACDHLAKVLAGKLKRYEVTGMKINSFPWEKKKPTILQSHHSQVFDVAV